MNYCKIYMSIIFKATAEKEQRLHNKQNGHYYEQHHIIPKTLGGTNATDNLINLTAREHFICHWLLVKMYKIGSLEREKMIFALNQMCYANPSINSNRKINSKVYQFYRKEHRRYVSKLNATTHKGSGNPQYGKHWFTNLQTGESKPFTDVPTGLWVKGRDWFKWNSNILYNIHTRDRVIIKPDKVVLEKTIMSNQKSAIDKVKSIWDNFHKSSSKNLTDFCNCHILNNRVVANSFKKFIPIYTTIKHNTRGFQPNTIYVGVYK